MHRREKNEMKLRKILIILLCITAMLCSSILFSVTGTERKARCEDASSEFSTLLADLVSASKDINTDSTRTIRADLRAIRSLNDTDYIIARSVAEQWKRSYLDPDYKPCLHDGSEKADALRYSGIPDNPSHAIVVLGYELLDGEMRPELKGRCEAAAAVARRFPRTVIICSGGATGQNNPESHTEAGLMRDYLVQSCGLDPARIYIDEQAMDTKQNAVNTFTILQERGIRSITVVTSDYHQRRGEAIYNAMAALVRQRSGWDVSLVGSYSFDTSDVSASARSDAMIAAIQIADILGIPTEPLFTPRGASAPG